VVTSTHDENHEQFLALDEWQLAHIPAVVEQQIEGPHSDVIISGRANVQSVEVEQALGVEAVTSPSMMQNRAGTAASTLLSPMKCFGGWSAGN